MKPSPETLRVGNRELTIADFRKNVLANEVLNRSLHLVRFEIVPVVVQCFGDLVNGERPSLVFQHGGNRFAELQAGEVLELRFMRNRFWSGYCGDRLWRLGGISGFREVNPLYEALFRPDADVERDHSLWVLLRDEFVGNLPRDCRRALCALLIRAEHRHDEFTLTTKALRFRNDAFEVTSHAIPLPLIDQFNHREILSRLSLSVHYNLSRNENNRVKCIVQKIQDGVQF